MSKDIRCVRCGDCIHADLDKMKCYSASDDCKSEYDLTEDDFQEEARCDFFHRKQKLSSDLERIEVL